MSKTTSFDYELDDYEKEIEAGFEKEGFKRIDNYESEMERYKAAARAALAKTRNINIRITQADLYDIQSKAKEQGIPYQTLISSLIRQYVNNKIYYNVLHEPRAPYYANPGLKSKTRKTKYRPT